MKYGLKIELYTQNQGLVIAIKNVIDNTSATIIYIKDSELENDDFTEIFNGVVSEIHFNNTTDRANTVNDLKGLNGMFNACKKPESKIVEFNFNHTENQPCLKTEEHRGS